jgi:hypothetical protein
MMLRSATFGSLLTVSLAAPAIAADLPRSEKLDFSTGKVFGVSFNTAGDDPLHLDAAVCMYENEGFEGTFMTRGKRAWSDADGDHIFSEYTGKFAPTSGSAGSSTITSGTGKYAGIRRNGPWTCKTLSAANGQLPCKQRFDYQLTAGGSTMPTK